VSDVLTVRALNRATRARPPFIGLWSRVQGFRPEDPARLAHDRKAVRATLMRGTLLLVDGLVAGTWKVERARAAAALVLEPFGRFPRPARAELVEEGKALARFLEPDTKTAEVRTA